MKVKRTERGWIGHFCCATACRFRRNTLLEKGEVRIVISTVGAMKSDIKGRAYDTIGCDRYFETMVFHAEKVLDRYWDAEVSREIYLTSPWVVDHIEENADAEANLMHENAVIEIRKRMWEGEFDV